VEKDARYDRVIWIVLLVLSAVFMATSLQYPLINTFGIPGPGFLPLIISILSVIFTLIELVSSFREKSSFNFKDDDLWSIAKICVAVLLYIVLSKLLGFVIPFAVMIFILFSGNYKWHISLLASIAIAVGMYILFIKFLSLPLPLNTIGF
jgi:asparagine N-glycosylation enzyme membrane subunit Stt3